MLFRRDFVSILSPTPSFPEFFNSLGYERIKPPLVEFEESLLSGSGAATATQTFRLMDPVSQRMMGLRPDMTVQAARIAETRLGNSPRPLRLSYAGQVLRVKGSQLRPERQFGQAGARCRCRSHRHGHRSPERSRCRRFVGRSRFSAVGRGDLRGRGPGPPVNARDLRAALDRKDAAAVTAQGGPVAGILKTLIAATGPADTVLPVLTALQLGPTATAHRDALVEIADLVAARRPDLKLTVDAVENRGYEYHSGVTYTFFALDVRGELGRGGRYQVWTAATATEMATGTTLFLDSILRAVPHPVRPKRIFVPFGTDEAATAQLRTEGWRTITALRAGSNDRSEARRLDCEYLFTNGDITPL